MKLSANELRIGNYVNCINDFMNPFRIDELNIYRTGIFKVGMGKDMDHHPATWMNEDIEPIPLTVDWLLKFGNATKSYYPNEIDVCDNRFTFIWKESYKYWYVVTKESMIFLTKIEFVHEYQNYIFALTGEELKIK
jgi:hypothetical protein